MTTLKEILAGKCGEENQIWVTHVTNAVKEWLQQKRQKIEKDFPIDKHSKTSLRKEWIIATIDILLEELQT